MTRSLLALISATGALAGGLLVYRLGGWDIGIIEAIAPFAHLLIILGGLMMFVLLLDHRRAAQWRRHMEHLDAIGKAVWRDRAERRTGS